MSWSEKVAGVARAGGGQALEVAEAEGGEVLKDGGVGVVGSGRFGGVQDEGV